MLSEETPKCNGPKHNRIVCLQNLGQVLQELRETSQGHGFSGTQAGWQLGYHLYIDLRPFVSLSQSVLKSIL